jgi:hypothetical protein
VRVEACELRQQNANPDGAFGNIETEKFFDGQAVAKIVGHRTEVIDTIRQRHDLLVKLRLAGFFDTSVQLADFGIETDDDFAVNFQNQAQDTVR